MWQRFPERIFFTTDLDARLLHPDSIKYTRNLVVASGFGLQLRKDLQGDVPPFRDVYQTSIFLATRRAFRDFHPAHQRPHQTDLLLQQTDPPTPRLFEIGKHHAIDLTQEGETEKTTDPINDPNRVQPPHEMTKLPGSRLTIFIICIISVIILLAFLFLWLLSNTFRNLAKGMGQLVAKHPVISILALALALALLIGFYMFILQDTSEEPFSLTEGVSIWPTDILRIIAIVLSSFFISTSISQLKKSDRELWEEFRLGNGPDKPVTLQSSGGFWNRLKNGYQEIRCDMKPSNRQSKIRVNEAWNKYVRYECFGFGFKPVIPLVFIYFTVCIVLVFIFGWPTTPARGVRSYIVTVIVLMIMIISFLSLTFFVFYMTGLCRHFVTRFLEQEPQWDLESLYQFKGKVGLRDRELSEWMLIRLIANRTEVVGNLIYYPFIVWFIIFLSRLYYFDNFHAPIGLAIVLFMCALLAWYCAFMLRRVAEKLRTDLLKSLAFRTHGANKYAERIQDLQKEIISINRGAFASYLQNPVVHSLLGALGGVGGVQVLELLGKLT